MSDDVEAKDSIVNDSVENIDLGEEIRDKVEILPEIPKSDFDDFSSMFQSPGEEKVKKRASNILKLTEENEKLKAELKAVTDRLEAAERRRKELREREQRIMEDRAQ
ncbi:hypothetical protein F5887DRAFT_940818 [Amanita rubescens]|nr:hypothetical protein F5887DRAFT_940818 [Amanita rubescens]